MKTLKNFYRNKKILVTGHTGFKGSWLALWLKLLGAKVVGISKDIPTKPSNFLTSKIQEFKNVLSDSELKEKTEFVNLLKKLDSANSTLYNTILN